MMTSTQQLLSPQQTSTRRSIFRQLQWQAAFEQDGYVVIDFLNEDEIKELSDAYFQLSAGMGTPAFTSSIISNNPAYRQAVSAIIEKTFARGVAEHLLDAHLFWGNYNTKFPNKALGTVPLHQDPSFMDEQRFYSLGFWVPLVDTDERNGALQVIPGSHTILIEPRCGGRPFPYHHLQERLLQQFAKPLHMKAGQAYIGSPALFHYSPPNNSDVPRIAAAGLAGPAESRLRYHHYAQQDDGPVAEVFEVDHEYYTTAPLFSRPDDQRYNIVDTVPLTQTSPPLEQLEELLANRRS